MTYCASLPFFPVSNLISAHSRSLTSTGFTLNPYLKNISFNPKSNGKAKLEPAIAKDTTNAEYRFLRLQIQEHAPKAVKYNDKLNSDKMFISKEYKNLSPEIQQAILDYSKQSKILLPADL